MKVKNVLKSVSVSLVVATLVGCASVSSSGGRVVNNKIGGTTYGAAAIAFEANGVKNTCKVIKDKDPRCANPDNYELAMIYTRYGYADGVVGVTALVDKNFQDVDKLRTKLNWSNPEIPFVKVEVVPGELGRIVEILPKGTCKWVGLAAMGGTVCPTLKHDYRKDFTGVVLSNF